MGRIFNIQRYSIHDGRGIRTIVFFKGCFLRCRWCCNPESQNFETEDMLVGGKTETVGRDVTVEEVMKAVERDRPYYRRSGGGLTLSGGEALGQPEFAKSLLKAAKGQGFHTNIQSTAMADFGVIAGLLPYLDEFLLDIKHVDAAKHEKFTGKRNDLALVNAKKIVASGLTDLIVRVPVIPGFNDTAEEIGGISSFAKSLGGVSELHLLPYHSFGEGKYAALGRDYPMGDAAAPSGSVMESLKQSAIRSSGLSCQVGG